MKHLLPFFALLSFTGQLAAQEIYESAANGNFYNQAQTWTGSGNSHNPPATGDCSCTIIIKAGHRVTLNTAVTISNALIILEGAGSEFTFTGLNDLKLSGNSAIDIQNTSARIFGTSAENIITLGVTEPGTTIYTGGVTMLNSATPGTVQGFASASSQRSNKNFSNSTLPVSLNFFSVTRKEQQIVLNWSTDVEINSDYFEIQRSGDSKNWTTLGSVDAHGNASTTQKYSYADNAPLNGENYYRLKMIDIDSKYEYSPIKSVNIAISNVSLKASPNPVSSTLNISVVQPGKKDYLIKLINRAGQIVFNGKYAGITGKISVEVSRFPEGTYFLELTDAAGYRLVKNIVIVRDR